MSRLDLMNAFLDCHIIKAKLAPSLEVQSLAGDASFRRYHRIHVPNGTYLLMDAPPQKERVDEFVKVAGILAQAVNVPDIIASDMENGFLLLQDFGTVELADVIIDDADADRYYDKALDTLLALQSLPTKVDLPAYDDVKLHQEMDLFSEWFLPYIGISMNTDEAHEYHKIKNALISHINNQPKVIVHRDYHSRNLMVDKDSDELGVIDFQDAVIGAYSYDVVSLIRDAYIDKDESWVHDKLHAFYHKKNPNIDKDVFIAQCHIMSAQRHLKVLGIFIRLYQRDGKDRYLVNIPKVMRDLLACISWLATHGYDEFNIFNRWLHDKIAPAYHQHFK